MNDDGPSVLTMIGAVALIVALVILVFFAAGYGFGRLFSKLSPPSTARIFWNRKQRPELGHRSADPVRRRPVLLADLLDLRRRAAAHPRPDARRLRDGGVAVPFVGTIVYMILRPPEYLEDVRERELEVQAAEARLHELDSGLCPHCDYRIERDFVRCPSCLRKLKDRCVSCQRPLDQAWTICPYCETEVPGAVAPTRRQRRSSRRSEADEDSLSLESEPALTREVSLSAEDPSEEVPAVTPAGGAPDSEVRAKPVAASDPASARSRSTGRARRPRPTS